MSVYSSPVYRASDHVLPAQLRVETENQAAAQIHAQPAFAVFCLVVPPEAALRNHNPLNTQQEQLVLWKLSAHAA